MLFNSIASREASFSDQSQAALKQPTVTKFVANQEFDR
jgi:hypothetical protein